MTKHQETMKAVVWTGNPTPEVATVPIPPLGPDEVMLRITRAGICGTDLSILAGLHPRAQAPLVLGHELAGTVVAFGDNVGESRREQLTAGVATVEPILWCGTCVACRAGNFHVCRNLRLYGIDRAGGMAEFFAVRADRVKMAPPTMAAADVVVAEPLAVAIHAVRMSGIAYGDTVCVIGGGPIGVLVAIVCRESGARRVVVSEPAPGRRAIAEALGFETVDPATDDLVAVIDEYTGGDGVDVVFESAGSGPAILQATQILRPRGRLIQVSIPKEPRPMRIVDISFREITIVGVRVYQDGDFESALRLIQEQPEWFRPIVRATYPIDRAPEAFAEAASGGDSLRVIVTIP